MLDIHLLGSGGMLPLPERYLTSLMVRYRGKALLIDCGEGTQMAIRSAGQGFKHIDTILLTHLHADHVSGIPGLLLTIGNSARTEPLKIIGPIGTERVVKSLRIIAPYLPYEIIYREISGEDAIFHMDELEITPVPVEHDLPCFAYKLELGRSGRFMPEQAKAFNIPINLWSKLQQGKTVEVEGKTYAPHQVLGQPRKGLKLCYATDLRPSEKLVEHAKDADLFVCEGNYGDPEKLPKALEYKHCMFNEAAQMAKDAGVKELWLTHFSPSMPHPEEYLHIATNIFPNSHIDRKNKTLIFQD